MTEGRQAGRVIGLDAHPYLFSASALSGADALQAKVEWTVDRVRLEELERVMRKRYRPGDVVVLEASGNSFAVAERLSRLGMEVHVLESGSVSRLGASYCTTDRIDSVKLARVYMSGLAQKVWTPDAKSRERRELYLAYRNAVCDAVRERNRFWAWCNEHGVRRRKGFRLTSPNALAEVLSWHSWTPVQQMILAERIGAFQEAEQRRVRFRAQIAEEVASDPQILALIRLMGVRHIIAFALAAFVAPIERFANPKKLVAYVGLNPRVSISGSRVRNGHLSHYGRSDLRALMIQAAQSVLRYGHGPVHEWSVALKMRKGSTVAVAALARKMVVAIWYLWMRRFSSMIEVTPQIRVKAHKIASEIPTKRIRSLGYKTTRAFEEYIIQTLLKAA